MRLRPLVAALALALSLGKSARADDPPPPKIVPKTATFAWDAGLLRMSVAYREIIDAEMQTKLTSGLPTVIVTRAYLFEEGASTPIALAAKSCRVVFDPWDEVFHIQLASPGIDTNVPSPTLEGVLRRCAEDRALPVAEQAKLRVDGHYLVQAIVEVNPISKEMLDRIKRWVSRPAGATSIGAGDALFGSFVGLFVARIGSADRQLSFKTQVVVVPPPPPPPPP